MSEEERKQKEREYHRKYVEKNKDKIKAHRELNKEKKSKYRKEYYKKNREKEIERSKKYNEENKELVKKNIKEWRKKNKEHRREYKRKNKERDNKLARKRYAETNGKYYKKYYRENKEKHNELTKRWASENKKWFKEYSKDYRKQNPHIFAWRRLVSRLLLEFDQEKTDRTHKILGYSATDLKLHIESLFTPKMSWDNYGEWHIDHIKPVSSFSPDTHPSIVCALSNLQPLWATTREIDGIIYIGNLNKGNKA